MPNPTTGPIDMIDAILRHHLPSLTATEAAVSIWIALRRGGHLKRDPRELPEEEGIENDD